MRTIDTAATVNDRRPTEQIVVRHPRHDRGIPVRRYGPSREGRRQHDPHARHVAAPAPRRPADEPPGGAARRLVHQRDRDHRPDGGARPRRAGARPDDRRVVLVRIADGGIEALEEIEALKHDGCRRSSATSTPPSSTASPPPWPTSAPRSSPSSAPTTSPATTTSTTQTPKEGLATDGSLPRRRRTGTPRRSTRIQRSG